MSPRGRRRVVKRSVSACLKYIAGTRSFVSKRKDEIHRLDLEIELTRIKLADLISRRKGCVETIAEANGDLRWLRRDLRNARRRAKRSAS